MGHGGDNLFLIFQHFNMTVVNKIIYPQIDLNGISEKSHTRVNWHNAPSSSTDYGEEGWMAYDNNYHYIYTSGSWKRQSLTNFSNF